MQVIRRSGLHDQSTYNALVKKAVHFYLLGQVVLLPAGLGLMSIGLNALDLFGSELVALPIIVSIGAGSIMVNSGIRRRRPQIEDAIRDKDPFQLSGNRAVWDCTRDSLQGVRLSEMKDSSPAGRVFFWLGPAVGVITARILGSGPTSLLVGFVLLGLGYLVTVLKIEVAASYYLELKELERKTNRDLILRNPN